VLISAHMRIRDRVRAWFGIAGATDRIRLTENQVVCARNEIGELRGGIAAIMKRLDTLESTLANVALALEAQSKAPVRPIYAPVMSSDWESLQAKGLQEFQE
jgi:hypothetical protein